MLDFLKAQADKFILLVLILWFAFMVTSPIDKTELGKDVVKVSLGALIGLIQGARMTQRKTEVSSTDDGAGGSTSSTSTLEVGAPSAPQTPVPPPPPTQERP